MKMSKIFIIAAAVAFVTYSAPTHAANECGTLAVGGTVVCDGSGTPATNISPYNSGITYTPAGTITVDGTATPLVINGRVTVSNVNSATPTYLNMLGNITVNRPTGSAVTSVIGSYLSTAQRDQYYSLGSGVTSSATTTTTTANNFYHVGASGSNAILHVNSAATINTTSTGTGTAYMGGIIVRDFNAGVRNDVQVSSSGPVTTTALSGSAGQLWGVYGGITGVTSAGNPVSINVSGPITINSQATGAMYCLGIHGANYSTGGVVVDQSGTINITGVCNGGVYGIFAGSETDTITSSAPINVTAVAGQVYGISTSGGGLQTINLKSEINITSAVNSYGVLLLADTGESPSYVINASASSVINSGGVGIDVSVAGSGGQMTFETGSSITGSSGVAINGSPAADQITSSGTVNGDINLSEGDDTLTLNAGSVNGTITAGDGDDVITIGPDFDASQLSSIDGGAGTNTLIIRGNAASLFSDSGSGSKITNFSSITFSDDSSVSLGGPALNTVADGQITIESGSMLGTGSATGDFTLNSSVTNAGALSLHQASPVYGDSLTISNNYTAGGVLELDAMLAGSDDSQVDTATINGNVINTDNPTIVRLHTSGSGAQTTGKGILVISANGASPDGAFALENNYVDLGNYRYTLVHDTDGNWYLQSTIITQEAPKNNNSNGSHAPDNSSNDVTLASTGEDTTALIVAAVITIVGAMLIVRRTTLPINK